MNRLAVILASIAVLIFLGLSSIFIVDEREKALVLQFGRVVHVKETPGIAFKVPLIQEVVHYDDRILSRDIQPLEVTPLNDRRLVVDAFARYRIADVEQFRQAVGVGGIPAAESRLDSILRSQTREILGSVSSNEILSADRAALMLRIRNGAIDEARSLGIEIIDVRLKRTDLPQENLEATFGRMRAEREREAADEIARGNEAAQRIRAAADRQQVEIVSDANRQSQIIQGQADARRSGIYSTAYGADQEFFEFYRSLRAYRQALSGENSTMVMSPEGQFFNYLSGDNPADRPLEPVAAAETVGGGDTAADAADSDTASTPAIGGTVTAPSSGSSVVGSTGSGTANSSSQDAATLTAPEDEPAQIAPEETAPETTAPDNGG